jgi:hypothetical protein
MVPCQRGNHSPEIPNRHRLIVHTPSQKVRQAPERVGGPLSCAETLPSLRSPNMKSAEYYLEDWYNLHA